MNLFTLLVLMIKASLFSTSGMGNVPSLHHDLLTRNWATEKQFAEALAIGQITPGPNGLWVISLSYQIGDLRAAMLALLAILMPPLLVVPLNRYFGRVKHLPAVDGFVLGLTLAVVGIFATVMLRLLQNSGIDVKSVAILIAAIALGASKRVPVIVILAGAACAGMLNI